MAKSDSEDIAAAMRDENDEVDEKEDDPLCPQLSFSAAKKAMFRRECRSALIVKGLGLKVPYLPLARRLNFMGKTRGATDH
ncbi:hypothetical protein LINGRAHAP2_LOCUS23829 [Linum grandiflorum]